MVTTSKTKKSSSGMDIPDWAYETLARCLLPKMQKYYATEEGKRAFVECKSKQQAINEGEAFNASPSSHILISFINLTKPNPSPIGISLGF